MNIRNWFVSFSLLFMIFFISSCDSGEDRRAIAKAKKALSRQRKDTGELDRVRGELRRTINRKIQAVRLLESASRVLGKKYLELGSYYLAEEALLESEFLKPYNAFIKKDLGECYYFLGLAASEYEERDNFFSKSRQYYLKTLELEPDLTEARYGLGLLLFFGFDEVGGAIGEMQKILEHETKHVGAHFALGRFYYEIGELNKSLGEYIALTRILPRNSPKKKKAEENIIHINREMGSNER